MSMLLLLLLLLLLLHYLYCSSLPFTSTSVAVFRYDDTCNGNLQEITLNMKRATCFKMGYGIMGNA
jgi:hypothetical protein